MENRNLQISILKETSENLELLIRGVFWPFWPLRGTVAIHPEQVFLNIPGQKPESLPKARVDHFIFDKLGAGVFVILALAPVSEPETKKPQDDDPDETSQEAPAEPQAKTPQENVKNTGTAPEETESKKLEKRLFGFFSAPADAQTLIAFLHKHQYKTATWLGNWRDTAKINPVTSQ